MRPTFSSGDRGEACATSHALPAVFMAGEAGAVGTDIHSYLDLVAENPAMKTRALERLPPDLRLRCAAIDLPSALHGMERVRTETAYAIDVETGAVRFLGKNLARAYPALGENEIAGTVDLEAELGGTPIAVDWKTGFGDVTPPEENMQVGAEAYAVARSRGADEAIGRLGFVDENGSITPVEHLFTSLDLEHVLHRWRTTLRRVREAEARIRDGQMPEVHMGGWCRYCPGRPHCPAVTAFARALVDELQDAKLGLEMMTPEHMGQAWTRAKLAIALGEEVVGALKLVAADMPLPLPDGKEVRPVPSTRATINGKRALELLVEKGATDEEISQVCGVTKFEQFRAMKPKKVA